MYLRRNRGFAVLALIGLAAGGQLFATTTLASASPRAAASTGSSVSQLGAPATLTPFATAPAAVHPSAQAAAAEARVAATLAQVTNRSLSRQQARRSAASGVGNYASSYSPPVVAPTRVASGTPGLTNSHEGLNAYQETQAEGVTFTPPDQGLCAGNGYVGEIVNDVTRVYTTSGAPAGPAISTNQFFGLPPVYNPNTGKYGPEPTDPSCLYDHSTNRWFVDEVILGVNRNTGYLTLKNWAYIAVSRTSNPMGAYYLYTIPLTDAHAGGMHTDCPCLGDFPHVGTDRYGFYLTTNEYPWSGNGFYGNGFNGAQLYAMSKTAMAHGAARVPVVHFSNTSIGNSVPGFTLWPANVPGTAYSGANNGTEYFMSSTAAAEANPYNFTGYSNSIGLYELSNTETLGTSFPNVKLDRALLTSEVYGEAPYAAQKTGEVPLADCIAAGCYPNVGPANAAEGPLDPSDTRPLTLWYADGRLFGALDTIMQVGGNVQSGPAWFVITPGMTAANSAITDQGYVGVAGNNVIYPSVATDTTGAGVMDFTLAGDRYFPSQAYVSWGPSGPTGSLAVAAKGAAPLDDFCEYTYFDCAGTSPPSPRPRYGDYSMASYADGSVYIANEYVASACSYSTYKVDATCGGTRAELSNWSTRISSLTP
jgi:hypothetical protein